MTETKGSSATTGTAARGCPVHRLTEIRDLVRTLRSPNVVNPPELYASVDLDPVNGGINLREFQIGSVIYTEGTEHRTRRKLLNRLIRPDSLTVIREDLVLPEVDRLLTTWLRRPDKDGQYRMDLVEFCERVFLKFTAKLIGLVDVDSDERMTALRSCAGPIAAGTSSAFLQDRTRINEMALAAKRKYVEEFFLPARDAYRAMLAEVAAGNLSDEDVPESLMKFIVTKADPAYQNESQAIVESTVLFAASVGTSTQSIVHTIDFLDEWLRKHPSEYDSRTDPGFLLDALSETLRLRAPFSPYLTRLAAEDVPATDGVILKGQEIHVEYVAANRSVEVFGADANEYNPRRPDPADGLPRYGVGFGTGTHQCYGMRVVLGMEGRGGAHVHMLGKLLAAGTRPDPSEPPTSLRKVMDRFSIEDIPRYTRYPVVLADWTPPQGAASR
jgi:cytochrome P450